MDDYQVELTAGAELDPKTLFLRTAERQGEAEARALLDSLEHAVASLANSPLRRALPTQLQSLGISEFRHMLVKPYRVLSRVQDQRVIVFLIAHEKRDFRSLLEKRLLR